MLQQKCFKAKYSVAYTNTNSYGKFFPQQKGEGKKTKRVMEKSYGHLVGLVASVKHLKILNQKKKLVISLHFAGNGETVLVYNKYLKYFI